MIVIRQITADRPVGLPKNEPFDIWGRMIPTFDGREWHYQTEKFETVTSMCFPDFPYDLTDSDVSIYGAFDGEVCVGLAVYRRGMFRYLYLEDLKVNQAYRGQGIASQLIAAGRQVAKEAGLVGLYTIGQDNNLSACLFYLSQGFAIGGFDNRSYRGTVQEDKADIYFYLDV